jgi:hypothetical protein
MSHIPYMREITTYGHPLESVIHDDPRGVFRGRFGKSVANLENGAAPFSKTPCPKLSWPFYETAPDRFGGRSGRYTKRPQTVLTVVLVVIQNDTGFGGHFGRYTKRPRPVSSVVLVVIQNDPGPFWRSLWPF